MKEINHFNLDYLFDSAMNELLSLSGSCEHSRANIIHIKAYHYEYKTRWAKVFQYN